MVAFVVSFVFVVVGTGACFVVAARRPPGTPLTWGEAIVAGTWVFGLMIVAYGVVPHQWLDWADNELGWRPDKLLLGVSSAGIKWGQAAATVGGSGRILVNYQALRDVVASALYGIFFVANVWLWAIWQKRGKRKPALEPVTSRFGRPVVREA